MSLDPIENTVTFDDETLSFDKVPEDTQIGRDNAVRRISKRWDDVKLLVDGIGGLKLSKPDFASLADQLIKSKTHAVMWEMKLTKTELTFTVEVGNTTTQLGKVRVPTALEDYRNFLGNLSGWSTGDHDIVPDKDLKKWSDAHPKKPTVYKTFDDLQKKSKGDVDAFRAWAKTDSKGKKAFEAWDKAQKTKPNDPSRAAASKLLDASMPDWYKSYD